MDTQISTRIDSLRYSVYTSDEIRKISVKEITSDSIFDKFSNHTVDGGLHDRNLGPETLKDMCEHCGLSYYNCNGHFGHIEFPLPMYNPMFFDCIFKLAKSFCFTCFHIYSAENAQTALHLLGCDTLPVASELITLKNKNSEELRKLAIRGLASRGRHACKKCQSRSWIIKHISHQQIAIRLSSKISESKKKQESQDVVGFQVDAGSSNNQINMDTSLDTSLTGPKSKAYDKIKSAVSHELKDIRTAAKTAKEEPITAALLRSMFRLLWMNDGELISSLYPVLKNFGTKLDFATDVFFMENMLVSPVLCRWAIHPIRNNVNNPYRNQRKIINY